MEIFSLLETLEDILDKSKSVPFTDKSIVEKDQFYDIIKEIRLKLPDELKQAKWIKEERERIIAEAQRDADDILKEAENRIIAMIDEHEITKKAYEKRDEIIADANERHRELRQGTIAYLDDMFAEMEDKFINLSESLNGVEMSIRNSLETIQNSRKELK